MIEDAKERLRLLGYKIHDKVFMNGFSASGGFTGLFAILHPEYIKAAAAGGGTPGIPDSQRLRELEAQVGEKINLKAYYNVPLYLYCGDQDGNYDPVAWQLAEQFFKKAGANFNLVGIRMNPSKMLKFSSHPIHNF